MYDHCGENPDNPSFQLNCLEENLPPSQVPAESLTLLEEYCPELVTEFGDSLCCAPAQITDLSNNLVLPEAFLAKCPACYHNFRQMFCAIACSPNQFQFLRAKEIVLNKEGRPMVKSLEAFVDDLYVTQTYDSCKNVYLSSLGGPAMGLLCGHWGAQNCTAHKWFDYMGSFENGFAPFGIDYKYVKEGDGPIDGVTPFQFPTLGCSASDPKYRCTCEDCKDSCSLTNPLMEGNPKVNRKHDEPEPGYLEIQQHYIFA
jgi:Niemann-Pick C1 protein